MIPGFPVLSVILETALVILALASVAGLYIGVTKTLLKLIRG